MSDKGNKERIQGQEDVVLKEAGNLNKDPECQVNERQKKRECLGNIEVQNLKQKKWKRPIKAMDVPDDGESNPVSQYEQEKPFQVFGQEKKEKVAEAAKKYIEKCNNSWRAKEAQKHYLQRMQRAKRQEKDKKQSLKMETTTESDKSNNVKYPCSFCDKPFSLEEMEKHHRRCDMAFQCEICFDYFPIIFVEEHRQCCQGKKEDRKEKTYQKRRKEQPFKQERKRPMMEAFHTKRKNKRMYHFDNSCEQEKQFQRMQLRELGLENLDLEEKFHSNPRHISEHYYDQQYDHEDVQRKNDVKGLTSNEINRLAAVSFKKGSASQDIDCGICTNEMEQADMVIRLPCLHTYHVDCLVPWLQMKSVCPTCKNKIK